MTVNEKSAKIKEYCDKHSCDECVLSDVVRTSTSGLRSCYSIVNSDDKRIIEENYDIIFGKSTNVDHPSHYNQGGIECIDAMVAAFGKEAVENFCLCNAFKYVWRNRDKNGFEDIDKAIWYLEKIKELCSD